MTHNGLRQLQNSHSRARGLNKRPLYFCFHKWDAHIWNFTVLFFLFFRKRIKHTLNLHDIDSMSVLNRPKYVIAAQLWNVISPTHFNRCHLNCYWREALSKLYKVNWSQVESWLWYFRRSITWSVMRRTCECWHENITTDLKITNILVH